MLSILFITHLTVKLGLKDLLKAALSPQRTQVFLAIKSWYSLQCDRTWLKGV